ncbi:unnamed protein product [Calypogeia fissa]
MANATFNVSAYTQVRHALLSYGNRSRRSSGSCALGTTAALRSNTLIAGAKSAAAGLGKRFGLKKNNAGWTADRSKNMKSSTGGRSLRAEIYIVNSEGELETEEDSIAIPHTQTAWIYKEYGSNEVLSIAEIIVPQVAPDQVLVKVHASALNPVDFKRLIGKFHNSDSELPTVPGYDMAGVVVDVGSEVTKFKVGDRVYGDVSEHALSPRQYGSLAQYTAVEEKLIAFIPQRLNFVEAASLPLAVETAYQSFEHVSLKEGETVLVLGGAGGVGSLAVQLAKHVFKASLVAATTSTPNVDFVKGLGADVVIDYKNEALTDHPNRYDVVLDTVGKGEAAQALKENGRAIALTGPVESPVVRFVLTSRGDVLEALNKFLENGALKPIIDPAGPFKFSEVVEAFAYLERGRATGKVVVSPIP